MPRQLVILATILFYCGLVAFIVVVTPARIAQTLYDWGQRIREHPLGWLLLATLIRSFATCIYIIHSLISAFQKSYPSLL
jgi:hypothetical protein